jgi:hypothetical protein
VTEDELLGVFHEVAGPYLQAGRFSPGALLWIERQIELAAARGAGDPELSNPAIARAVADDFFRHVVGAATPNAIFQSVTGQPLISEADLQARAAAYWTWPFGKRPDS